jgi:hypothetical protein
MEDDGVRNLTIFLDTISFPYPIDTIHIFHAHPFMGVHEKCVCMRKCMPHTHIHTHALTHTTHTHTHTHT